MKAETQDLLNRVCDGLVKVAGWVREDTAEALAPNDPIVAIRHYDATRKATVRIKEAREALADIEERLSREQIPDVMRNAGVKTITVEDVGRVTISHRYSASILDKPLGYEWLRENGHGAIITETVNSSTMAAFAKEYLESEGRELPVELFKVGTSPYTSITKAK